MKKKRNIKKWAGIFVVTMFLVTTVNVNAIGIGMPAQQQMNQSFELEGLGEQLEYEAGQVIVKLQFGVNIEETGIEDDYTIVEEEEELNAYLIEVPLGEEQEAVEYLRTIPGVQFAEVNSVVTIFMEPNDPLWRFQYGPKNIHCPDAWDEEIGDETVIVSVIDTGIDFTHPDLQDNFRLIGSWDFVQHGPIPLDNNGHGTHCAGIIAAEINNEIGIAGIANVKIIAMKVFNRFGMGNLWRIARAIVRSTLVGADVISMSCGVYRSSPLGLLWNACNFSNFVGCTLVAAAGNGGSSNIAYPAKYDCVIAVGAVDESNEKTWWSDYGEELDVVAPGDEILSTMPTYHVTLNDEGYSRNYDNLSGTSMACPHVAGVMALYYSKNGCLVDNDLARERLHESADDLGAPGKDIYYGYGLVNASGILSFDDKDLVLSQHL